MTDTVSPLVDFGEPSSAIRSRAGREAPFIKLHRRRAVRQFGHT